MIKNIFEHWRYKKRLVEYLAGGMSASERLSFELHLSKCTKCRDLLAQEREFNKALIAACTPVGTAWSRTSVRLQKLPDYYSSPDNVLFPISQTKRPKKSWERRVIWSAVGTSIAIILICLFIGEYFSIIEFMPLSTSGSSGKLTQSIGEKLWIQPYRSTVWQKLAENQQINPGDKVRTTEYGKGLLKLSTGGRVWLNYSSQLTFLSNVNTAFEVNAGEVYITLKHHHGLFQVNTPAGMVRVYGTEFQIAVDSTSEKTKVYCFQSKVYFENRKGQVVLAPGYHSEAVPQTQPTEPTLFNLEQMVSWKTQFDQLSLLSETDRRKLHQSFLNEGDVLFDDNKYDEALKFYREAALLDPNDYIPYYGIGRVYRELGQYASATAIYNQVIEQNPNQYSMYYQLAICLTEMKLYPEAEKALLEVTSDSPIQWILFGNIYILEHQADKAEDMYQKAMESTPQISKENYSQLHGGLAEIARQRGDYKTALAEISKALQSESVPSLVYAEAAWIYRSTNNPEKEKSAWKKYLAHSSHGSFAEDAHKRLSDLNSI